MLEPPCCHMLQFPLLALRLLGASISVAPGLGTQTTLALPQVADGEEEYAQNRTCPITSKQVGSPSLRCLPQARQPDLAAAASSCWMFSLPAHVRQGGACSCCICIIQLMSWCQSCFVSFRQEALRQGCAASRTAACSWCMRSPSR